MFQLHKIGNNIWNSFILIVIGWDEIVILLKEIVQLIYLEILWNSNVLVKSFIYDDFQ